MTIVSETQSSFEHGAIDPEFYGHQSDAIFQKSVKELKNIDILTSGVLQKRTGLEEVWSVNKAVSLRIQGRLAELTELSTGTDKTLYDQVKASYQFENLEFAELPIIQGREGAEDTRMLLQIIKLTVPANAPFDPRLSGLDKKLERYYLKMVVGTGTFTVTELKSFFDQRISVYADRTNSSFIRRDLGISIGYKVLETSRKITLRGLKYIVEGLNVYLFPKEEDGGRLYPLWPLIYDRGIEDNRDSPWLVGRKVTALGQGVGLVPESSVFGFRRMGYVGNQYNRSIEFFAGTELGTPREIPADRVYEVPSFTEDRANGLYLKEVVASGSDSTSIQLRSRLVKDPSLGTELDIELSDFKKGGVAENSDFLRGHFFNELKMDLTELWKNTLGRRVHTEYSKLEEIYKRGAIFEGGAVFVGKFTNIEEKSGTTITKDILFWLLRSPSMAVEGFENRDAENALMFVPAVGEPAGLSLGGQYVTSRRALFNWLMSLNSVSVYSTPIFNFEAGFPSGAQEVGGRLFYAAKDFMLASAVGVSEGITSYLPKQYSLSTTQRDDLENAKVGEQDTTLSRIDALATKLGSVSSADEVYFRQLELVGISGSDQFPYRKNVSGEGVARAGTFQDIQWVENVRGLIVGATQGETRASLIPTSKVVTDVNFNSEQSFRGSSSPFVARGDYSLFFVGADRKTVWQLYYDDGEAAGFRSKDATYFKRLPENINDLLWDQKRRALFVLSGNRLFVYYFQDEYSVQGWAEWTFGIDFKILRLTGRNTQVGAYLEVGGKVGLYQFNDFNSQTKSDYADIVDGTKHLISSEVDFFKVPMKGDLGDAAPYKKRVGYATVLTRNVTELWFGGERFLYKESGDPIQTKDLSVYVKGQSTIMPTLKLTHTKEEPAMILNTTARYDILER